MEIITVLDMAQILGISSVAVNKRLQRKGRQPFKYIGSAGIYTEADLDSIRDGGTRGRPKAKAQEEPIPETKAKPKKTTKKT